MSISFQASSHAHVRGACIKRGFTRFPSSRAKSWMSKIPRLLRSSRKWQSRHFLHCTTPSDLSWVLQNRCSSQEPCNNARSTSPLAGTHLCRLRAMKLEVYNPRSQPISLGHTAPEISTNHVYGKTSIYFTFCSIHVCMSYCPFNCLVTPAVQCLTSSSSHLWLLTISSACNLVLRLAPVISRNRLNVFNIKLVVFFRSGPLWSCCPSVQGAFWFSTELPCWLMHSTHS